MVQTRGSGGAAIAYLVSCTAGLVFCAAKAYHGDHDLAPYTPGADSLEWGLVKVLACASRASSVLDSLLQTQLGVFVVSNCIIAFCATTAVATTSIFLGSLTPTEAGRLTQRLLKYLLVKVALVGLVVLPSEVQLLHWLPWLAVIGQLKMVLGLSKDRLAGLSVPPAAGLSRHSRTLCLLLLILAANSAGMLLLSKQLGQLSWAICLLFALDMGITAVDAAKATLSCVAFLMDEALATNTSLELPATLYGRAVATWEVWQGRGRDTFFYQMELATDVAVHLLTLLHHMHVWLLHGLSFHLLDALLLLDTRAVVLSTLQRLQAHKVHSAATSNLDSSFPDAHPSLLDGECEECVICRDRMAAAKSVKQLPCGHLFHLHCLRAWLQQSGSANFTCPMCRMPLCVAAPPPTAGISNRRTGTVAALPVSGRRQQQQQWQLQARGTGLSGTSAFSGPGSGLMGSFSFSLSIDEGSAGGRVRQQLQQDRAGSWEPDGLQDSPGSSAADDAGFDDLAAALAASLQVTAGHVHTHLESQQSQQHHQQQHAPSGSVGSDSPLSSTAGDAAVVMGDEGLTAVAAEEVQASSSSTPCSSGSSSRRCSDSSSSCTGCDAGCTAAGMQSSGSSAAACCCCNHRRSIASRWEDQQQQQRSLQHCAAAAVDIPAELASAAGARHGPFGNSSSAQVAEEQHQQWLGGGSSSSRGFAVWEDERQQYDLIERYYSRDPLADSDALPDSRRHRLAAAGGRVCRTCSRVIAALIHRPPSRTPSPRPDRLDSISSPSLASVAAAAVAAAGVAAAGSCDAGDEMQNQHCSSRQTHRRHRHHKHCVDSSSTNSSNASRLCRHGRCHSPSQQQEEHGPAAPPPAAAAAGPCVPSGGSSSAYARAEHAPDTVAAGPAAVGGVGRRERLQKYAALRLDSAWEPDQPSTAAAEAAAAAAALPSPVAAAAAAALPSPVAAAAAAGKLAATTAAAEGTVAGDGEEEGPASCPPAAAAAVVKLITSPREAGRRRERGKWGRRRCVAAAAAAAGPHV